jgi:5-bromo-4-chloroindolyl phosphate hydrolysis protein
MDKQNEHTINALIQKDINYMRVDIVEIKESIKALNSIYATKSEMTELANRTIALEKSSNIWKIISPTFAAVLGSVVTFLTVQFLQNA